MRSLFGHARGHVLSADATHFESWFEEVRVQVWVFGDVGERRGGGRVYSHGGEAERKAVYKATSGVWWDT